MSIKDFKNALEKHEQKEIERKNQLAELHKKKEQDKQEFLDKFSTYYSTTLFDAFTKIQEALGDKFIFHFDKKPKLKDLQFIESSESRSSINYKSEAGAAATINISIKILANSTEGKVTITASMQDFQSDTSTHQFYKDTLENFLNLDIEPVIEGILKKFIFTPPKK